MRKTQPPKSPLSGGLGVKYWVFTQYLAREWRRVRKQESSDETVQESLARLRCNAENPTPNPLNPPCQGDLSLNSPLIRGARGVRNDAYWFFAQSRKQGFNQMFFQNLPSFSIFPSQCSMLNAQFSIKTNCFCAFCCTRLVVRVILDGFRFR